MNKILRLTTSIFIPTTLFAALLIMVAATPPVDKAQPPGFIPMWSDRKGGHEVLLINSNNIVTIKPLAEDHLEVLFSDGSKIEVFEDYSEFKGRIKDSLK